MLCFLTAFQRLQVSHQRLKTRLNVILISNITELEALEARPTGVGSKDRPPPRETRHTLPVVPWVSHSRGA